MRELETYKDEEFCYGAVYDGEDKEIYSDGEERIFNYEEYERDYGLHSKCSGSKVNEDDYYEVEEDEDGPYVIQIDLSHESVGPVFDGKEEWYLDMWKEDLDDRRVYLKERELRLNKKFPPNTPNPYFELEDTCRDELAKLLREYHEEMDRYYNSCRALEEAEQEEIDTIELEMEMATYRF